MGVCDFLYFFPEPTWRAHPSTDFDAKWLKRRVFKTTCAFWCKNCNVLKSLTLRPTKPPKFAQFWSGLRKFSRLTLGVSRVNTPESNKSVIVNSQRGGGKFKYVPKFCIGGKGHVISRMRNDDLHSTGPLEANISKTLRDRGLVTMGD